MPRFAEGVDHNGSAGEFMCLPVDKWKMNHFSRTPAVKPATVVFGSAYGLRYPELRNFPMPVEIEAKMKVPSFAAVRERLGELGAELKGEYLEINTFYDTEDRTLLAADEGLRIRTRRDTRDGKEVFRITYKGPRTHGPLKSRHEIELGVDNAQLAEELLTALGFIRVLSFEKRRQSWSLDNVLVDLDELPHLGNYIEIEGPDDDSVFAAREKLRLSEFPIVKTSYVTMLLSHLQELRATDRVVAFPK